MAAPLLKEVAARGIAVDYVSKLLATLERGTKDQRRKTEAIDSSFVTRPSPVLVEPLTKRELQVLRLLTTDLTSPEIA